MKGPWIKLWRSFLSDPTIQYLKKRHGDVTVTLLVALLTNADDGKVIMPEDEIAILCDLGEEEFARLIDLVIERGIIYRCEEGHIMFKNWNKYQESESTARTRKWREARDTVTVTSRERHSDGECDGSGDANVTVEVEAEVEVDNKKSSSVEERHKYGSEKNVFLTDSQKKKLEDEIGVPAAMTCIEHLSKWKAMKGKTYKRDDLAIRQWVMDAVGAKPLPPPDPVCPLCGRELCDNICVNAACPQYEGT